MFEKLKKWWEKRGAAEKVERGLVYDLGKRKDAGPRRRPKEMESHFGRIAWRLAANYHGCLRNLAAMKQGAGKGLKGDGGTYGKWELRRMQSHCDRQREKLFWARVAFAREQRQAAERN